jgi:hypothetical protein
MPNVVLGFKRLTWIVSGLLASPGLALAFLDQPDAAQWLALAGAGFAVPWLVFFGGLWVTRGFTSPPAQTAASARIESRREATADAAPPTPETGTKPKTNWMWPQIRDEESAETAIKEAVGYSAIVALGTAGIASASVYLGRDVWGYNAWHYTDAVIVGVISLGLWWKHSRVAAVAGLLYWLLTLYVKWQAGRIGFITILVLLGFIHGVRGTFAYWKYRSAREPRSVQSA